MRIIAGTRGSRRIEAPPGTNTRPTHEKVREALYSMIGPFFDGGQALDLFAGTGALGLEALSRGMEHCVFVEKDRTAQNVVRRNIDSLDLDDRSELMRTDFRLALDRLASDKRVFDLILLDPPYDAGFMPIALEKIRAAGLLGDNGVIFVEVRSGKSFQAPEGFDVKRRRSFGEAEILLLGISDDRSELSGEPL